MWPGSYKDYVLVRSAPSPYPKTAQQAKIGEAGRKIREKCKGKTKHEFAACRHAVFAELGILKAR
jgi:hypothetical protein